MSMLLTGLIFLAEGRESAFIPSAKLSDLGGIDQCIEEIMELIAMPLAHPEVYIHTGVQPPRGVLLHGPPGCGKTRLAHAIAGVGYERVRWVHLTDWLLLLCRNSKYLLSISLPHPLFLVCPVNPKRRSGMSLKMQR